MVETLRIVVKTLLRGLDICAKDSYHSPMFIR